MAKLTRLAFIAFVAALLGNGTPMVRATDAIRPNIVFILADDLGKEWISCYGAEDVATPHIDALARDGIRFENAWSMPQCTPTRVTLLTGQYPFRHGWTNHFDVPRYGSGCHFDPQQNASFGLLLRNAGYATAIAGKWQIDDFRIEPRALDEAGFDEWCVWTGGEGGNPKSDERYWTPYIHVGTKSSSRPAQFGPDIYCDFLIDFMDRHRDRAFLAYYPMCLTHPPLVQTPDEPDAMGKTERHKAMVRYMDKLVGRLVNSLSKAGVRERTIVIFTTDNGTSGPITGTRLGHRVTGAKSEMVEAGTAMPFIANGPGLVPAGVVSDALTDFTDILPTFAELAEPRRILSSSWTGLRSLRFFWVAQRYTRTWILSMGGHPASFRAGRVVPAQEYDDRVIRDKRWKLWVSTSGEPERLFDMQRDPWETHNLIDSSAPDARAAREKLAEAVAAMPRQDALPRYRPNPAQPWDKFHDHPMP